MKPENKTMRDIPNPQTSGPDQKRLSIYGKTPSKLWSCLVQVDPGRRETVTIDAYADLATFFDAPACALACECESETAAQKMVADIHYALVGYLTNRIRRRQGAIKDTRDKDMTEEVWKVLGDLEKAVNAILGPTILRAQMLESDTLQPFYEELTDILEDAGRLRRLHTREANHDDKPDQEPVRMGDAETSAPGTIDPGADSVAGDCQGAGNSRL